MTGWLGSLESRADYEQIKDQLTPEARASVKSALSRRNGSTRTIWLTEDGDLAPDVSGQDDPNYGGHLNAAPSDVDFSGEFEDLSWRNDGIPDSQQIGDAIDSGPISLQKGGRDRIMVQTSADGLGPVSGRMWIRPRGGGEKTNLGRFETDPTGGAIDTDYVVVDETTMSSLSPGTYDIGVEGIGETWRWLDVQPASEREQGDYLPPGSSEPNPDRIDPSNYSLIVNADNESGIAFAPSVVRSGRTADPNGTDVELPDGRTATVYPREDADEAIRDTETGDPIDSETGSGGVEGGVGSDGDVPGLESVGAGAAVVAVLALAAAARRYA